MIDTLRMSFLNLGRKKSRSLLTVAGIAIGVASVVLIASISDIGKYAINEEVKSFGMNGLMISSNRKVPGTQLADSHLEIVRESGVVDSAIPIVADYTKTYMRKLMMDCVIWGIDYGANQVIAMDALHGRLITKNDVTARRKICVIDQNIAQAYYKRDNIVGKTIGLQFGGVHHDFEIVGVVASGGSLMQGLIGELIPGFVYLPYTTLQEISGKDSFDQIAVQIKQGVDGDVAGKQIVSTLSGMSGQESGAYKFDNMMTQKAKLDSVLNIITIVLSAIAGVSLIVAGLSIMTMMLVSVNERTREIGIKKSIGASRRNILAEFLVEAFVLSLTGSLAGTAAGTILVIAGSLLFGLPIRLNGQIMVFCILFSVLVGAVFGVYPASVASKMRPVDALRFD